MQVSFNGNTDSYEARAGSSSGRLGTDWTCFQFKISLLSIQGPCVHTNLRHKMGRYSVYEIASLVYGYIKAVILSIFTVYTLIIIVDLMSQKLYRFRHLHDDVSADEYRRLKQQEVHQMGNFVMVLLTFLLLHVVSFTELALTVFLLYGIHKKRPGFVKAYFITALVVTILVVTGIAVDSILDYDMIMMSSYINIYILIGCLVQFTLLWIVYKAYENIKAQPIQIVSTVDQDKHYLITEKPKFLA